MDMRTKLAAAAPIFFSEVRRLRVALDQITDLSRNTRAGGASVGDLGMYEQGLDAAIEIAHNALKGAA
jgi:hypothetical protein